MAGLRVLIVEEPEDRRLGANQSFDDAIVARFDADIAVWQDTWPDASGYDVVLSRVFFRRLAELDSLPWRSFDGLKVLMDEDAYQDAFWSQTVHQGAWQRALPRLGFDLLITTGQRTFEHLQRAGLPTALLHKAYDERVFFDEGGERSGLCAYGADYPSRLLARAQLEAAGVATHQLAAPYEELNGELNRYAACLVCTLDADVIGRRFGWKLLPHRPRLVVRHVRPGPEPMLKLFESAAAGCAPFTDWSPDLEGLGFADGRNVIIYRDLDELTEKVLHYMARPRELAAIGQAAAELVRERHTWAHRADELARIIINRGRNSAGTRT